MSQKIVILLNMASFFSWNTPKFFYCPVDAENGFKLDDWIDMRRKLWRRVSQKFPLFLKFF